MKVTNLKQQQRNPDRVSVFVDGRYSFSLHMNELLSERLHIGSQLDDVRVKNLKRLSDEGKLRMRSMEWLMNRPHSEREFRDYLRRKKIEPDAINELTAYFLEKKLLDDERYARWLIEVRASRLKSERALRAELRSKGVGGEIIDASLQAQPVDNKQQLRALVVKKRRLARYQDKQKLVAFLARQGFGFDDITEVLREIDG